LIALILVIQFGGMVRYEYLIIGGGIAGVTAAETIRERDPAGSIAILSDEQHLPYSRVLLPSYLKRRIKREQLFLRGAEDFSGRRIDFYRGRAAAGVDTRRREAATVGGEAFGYQKLLIAGGGKANWWPPEFTSDLVYRLQTMDDADRLLTALPAIREPVIVGSSFIALEFIEIFILNRITPRILTKEPRFFGRMLDEDGGELLEENFKERGIRLFFDEEIISVERAGEGLRVSAKGAGKLSAGALAVGIGIERNTGFLKDSGILFGEKGGVRTNEFLETNAAGVFAAGDIAEYYDMIAGRRRLVGNWTNAVLQGKIAGVNMVGRRIPFANVSSYAITNLGFQLTAVGECDNGLEAVSRLDERQRRYARFFIRDGVLVGAFLINSFKDKPHLAELIAKRANLEKYSARLADPAFDIRRMEAIK
jgi:NTE family protein